MARVILLDAGLIGLIAAKNRTPAVVAFEGWLKVITNSGADLLIPDVTRFEVRRELLRIRATAQLRNLDQFCTSLGSAPVTPEAWDRAGEFWAIVRQTGKPTSHPEALDADAILAATASTIAQPGDQVIIATTNVGHLERFPGIDARRWQDIP